MALKVRLLTSRLALLERLKHFKHWCPLLAPILQSTLAASPDEYMMVGVFGTVTALLHLANRADTRKYFRSKR